MWEGFLWWKHPRREAPGSLWRAFVDITLGYPAVKRKPSEGKISMSAIVPIKFKDRRVSNLGDGLVEFSRLEMYRLDHRDSASSTLDRQPVPVCPLGAEHTRGDSFYSMVDSLVTWPKR